MPTHSGSPVFYICLIGKTSWIDLILTASNKKYDHLKLLNNEVSQSLRIPTREAIIFSLKKTKVEQVVELQINISFKVNLIVFALHIFNICLFYLQEESTLHCRQLLTKPLEVRLA